MAISTLKPPARSSHGPTCAVCHALATLPPADAKALQGHLANPEWRYTELSDALASDPDTPLVLPAWALGNHCRGQCAARKKLR